MPTPAYTAPSRVNPQQSQNGLLAIASALSNDNAYHDAIINGTVSGWTLATTAGTGTAEKPQFKIWSNGTERLRLTFTWSGDYVATVLREWSNDSGASYVTIATETPARDGSGNTTTATNSSLLSSWLFEIFGKLLGLRTTVTNHTGATGTAVHGLGSMAIQSASAVAITGGSASLTYEREAIITLGSISASTAVNWSSGGHATVTAGAAGAAITFSNLPSGVVGYMTFEITNGATATTLFSGLKNAGGVAPVFSAAGRDILVLMCRDGATVNVVGFLKGMA